MGWMHDACISSLLVQCLFIRNNKYINTYKHTTSIEPKLAIWELGIDLGIINSDVRGVDLGVDFVIPDITFLQMHGGRPSGASSSVSVVSQQSLYISHNAISRLETRKKKNDLQVVKRLILMGEKRRMSKEGN